MTPRITAPLTHRAVLAFSIPVMLANASQPLTGVVNTAVIGQLGNAAMIGGVAIASLIFSFLFWGFGFLRMSTGGLAAQATGAGDTAELTALFWRSLLLGLVIGACLLAAAPWAGPLSVALMGGSPAVQGAALDYFNMRIFSAPAALANFVILGWLIGQGRSTIALALQLLLNVSNMALSAVFVLRFGWAVSGVGLAATFAEYTALVPGLAVVAWGLRRTGFGFDRQRIRDAAKLREVLSSNTDIMIRTVLLLFAWTWFTARSARLGDEAVAANTILLHFFEVAAYMTDGFAQAAEAFVGQAVGARDRARYQNAIRLSTLWGIGFGALSGLLIWQLGPQLIALMTTDSAIVAEASQYLVWAAVLPMLGAACFLYDGIYTGAMATREMRNMMLLSTAFYLALWAWLEPTWGNHGLWAALCIFMIARGLTFALRLPTIERNAFS